METQIHNTSVNLDGLLEVLGKNLYSTASVAIRELIQNAHDACERHRLEYGEKDFQITLTNDFEGRALTITDNGSGLTRQEVIDYLATVGAGYTRVLRNQTDTKEMIGYFGLGFLSAYVVSEKVEVWTSSFKSPDKSWYFTSAGGKRFALDHAEKVPVGTIVKLHLSDDFVHLGDTQTLTNLISQYCCLLNVPIFLSGENEALNHLPIPWKASNDQSPLKRKKQYLSFAAKFERSFEPIVCIPIPDNNELGLSGLLWVQDGGSYSSTDNRNVHVFIRGMFISDKEKELLPKWAGFCGAVLESANFQPTASREALKIDDYFNLVCDFLRKLLVSELRSLILHSPEAWRRILRQHNQALLGAAVCDEKLFEAMSSFLQVPTSLGDMNLKSIVRQSNGDIYINQDVDSSVQDILIRARNIPLVLGYRFAASEFCRFYADKHNIEIHWVGFRQFDQSLFKSKQVGSSEQAFLRRIYTDKSRKIHFSSFEPDQIPLVLVEDMDVKLKHKIEADENDRRIGTAALALAKLHTAKIPNEITHHLYINMASPLIQKIVAVQNPQAEAVAKLSYSIMENLANEGGNGHLATMNQQLLTLLSE